MHDHRSVQSVGQRVLPRLRQQALAFLLLVATVLLLSGCVDVYDQRDALKPFLPYMEQYRAAGKAVDAEGGPYIRGKVLVLRPDEVEPEDGAINWRMNIVYFGLPEELRATTPEEVGTLVWVRCGEKAVGTYTDGTSAYQGYCVVTVTDWTLRSTVGQQLFEGIEPKSYKTGPGSRHAGEPATRLIVEWLASLPRK